MLEMSLCSQILFWVQCYHNQKKWSRHVKSCKENVSTGMAERKGGVALMGNSSGKLLSGAFVFLEDCSVVPSVYSLRKSRDPFLLNASAKSTLVTAPTPSFRALTMTLHMKCLTLFLSLGSHSPESRLSCTTFLSPSDSQLQVYKPGSESSLCF